MQKITRQWQNIILWAIVIDCVVFPPVSSCTLLLSRYLIMLRLHTCTTHVRCARYYDLL
jgi:hypothetical protein